MQIKLFAIPILALESENVAYRDNKVSHISAQRFWFPISPGLITLYTFTLLPFFSFVALATPSSDA